MKRRITAEFDTFDAAEMAAAEIKRRYPDARILSVHPEHPESIRLTRWHGKRFTLLPTAVTTMNYITAVSETDYNYDELNEVEKRQTSHAVLICSEKDAEPAERLLIGKGGNIMPPS